MKKPTLTDEQKQMLLDRQFEKANSGDVQLLIHLGLTELGQIKSERVVIDEMPEAARQLNYEDILDLLARRHAAGQVIEGTFLPIKDRKLDQLEVSSSSERGGPEDSVSEFEILNTPVANGGVVADRGGNSDIAQNSTITVYTSPCCNGVLQYLIKFDAYGCSKCNNHYTVLSTEKTHVLYDGGPPKLQSKAIQHHDLTQSLTAEEALEKTIEEETQALGSGLLFEQAQKPKRKKK